MQYEGIPLVGRERELKRLQEMIADEGCHLVTITGLGGIGKTRLATELVRRLAPDFDDGAYFVEAQRALTCTDLYRAVADAAGLRLASGEPLEQRVRDWLSETSAVIVLDNLEQIRSVSEIIATIVAGSPLSSFVATSRTPLGIEGEWRFQLEGLSTASNFGREDSVSLFVQAARRVNPSFETELRNSDTEIVEQIDELVGGVPLAIEMVAAWTRMLSLHDLLDELSRSSDLLISDRTDRPERHQSMDVVFDSSWQFLSETHREKLASLAVLQGPFDRSAAATVASASLRDLRDLVDASMLRTEQSGLFSCHPVLRRYAIRKLEASDRVEEVRIQIARHYSKLAANMAPSTQMPIGELELTRIADSQLQNFQQALSISIESRIAELLRPLAVFFIQYLEFKAQYQEGLSLARKLLSVLKTMNGPDAELLAAMTLSESGWWHLRLGNTSKALSLARESIRRFRDISTPSGEIPGNDPVLLTAYVASVNGETREARKIAERTLSAPAETRSRIVEILARYLLATLDMTDGDLGSAKINTGLVSELVIEAGESWFYAYCLNLTGDLAATEGDYGRAIDHFDRSYQIRRDFDDPVGMGEALIKLGEVSLISGDEKAARKSFADALTALESTGDRGNIGMAQAGLGLVLVSLERFDEAIELLRRSLIAATDLNFHNLRLRTMAGLARLHTAVGERQLGEAALEQIRAISVSDLFIRAVAGGINPEARDSTASIGDLEDLQERLADTSNLRLPRTKHSSESKSELSDREIEILGLMAGGATNPEIAERLIISPGTVKWYSSQIYTRLGVRNRAQAIAYARGRSII